MKLMKPAKYYPGITDFYTYILKTFSVVFLLPTNFSISFGICSAPKQSEYVTLSPFTYNGSYWFVIIKIFYVWPIFNFG